MYVCVYIYMLYRERVEPKVWMRVGYVCECVMKTSSQDDTRWRWIWGMCLLWAKLILCARIQETRRSSTTGDSANRSHLTPRCLTSHPHYTHTHTQPAFARCGNKYKYKPLTSYMLIYMRRKSLCCGRAAERKRTTDLATTNVRYVRNFIWTGFVVFTWWWSNGETNSSLFPHTICVLCVSLEHIYIYRHIHIYMPHPRRTSSGE